MVCFSSGFKSQTSYQDPIEDFEFFEILQYMFGGHLFATFCLIFGTEPYLVSKGCLYEVRRRAPRIYRKKTFELIIFS